MKKKVYILDEFISSQMNGIGTFLSEFLYCMRQIEVDICLLTFNAKVEEFTILEDEGIKKMLFPPLPHVHFMNNAKIINNFFKLYIPDSFNNVIFFNHSPCRELLSLLKKSHPQSKLVLTIHDLGWTDELAGDVEAFRQMIHQEKSAIENKPYQRIINSYNVERKMYELVDKVVCLSQDTFDLLKDIYSVPSHKIALIPNGIRPSRGVLDQNIDELKRRLFISINDKVLLFSGRPTENKGMFALLQAFELILKKEPNTQLIIAGYANSDNMEKLIKEASAYASRVTFKGLINKDQLNELYSAADVGIIPSYFEQCPYTGIEMMMHGLPVVASSCYGLRNMFHNGVNARLVGIGNIENQNEFVQNLAAAVLEVLASDDLRQKLMKGAESVYQSTYHMHHMKKNYLSLLKSI